MTFLKEWLQEVEEDLRKSSDIHEIKKAQGKDEVLRRLVELQSELRSYGDKLLRGEVKKVEVPQSAKQVLGK